MKRVSRWAVWVLLWSVVGAGVAIVVRHPFPIDETRYLAVAWEMHWRDRWLLPVLEGEPYVQKPPLLFWLIRVGWLAFGVSEEWPRVVVALFAVLALWATAELAKRLSAQSAIPIPEEASWLAPLVLAGFVAWPAWSSALYFDVPLTACVVLGALALVRLASTGQGGVWLALATGFGALMKGPLVAIPFVGLVALLPIWAVWHPWRLRFRLQLRAIGWGVVGALLPLAWLLAVYVTYGSDVVGEVLRAQGIGRLEEGADHAAPGWWYLPVVVAMVWPMGWFGGAWRQLWRARALPAVRFAFAAVLPSLLILSAIAGKRAQYLLPLLPFWALAFALGALGKWREEEAATRERCQERSLVQWGQALPLLPMLGGGLLLVVAPMIPKWRENVAWLTPRWAVVGLGLLLLFVAAWWVATWLRRVAQGGRGWQSIPHSLHPAATAICLTWSVVLWFNATASWASDGAFNPQPIAERLSAAQAAGRPVVWVGGRHHAAWHFAARRTEPLPRIAPEALPDWRARHPDGLALVPVSNRTLLAQYDDCLRWRSDWVCFLAH
ncbi:ArnT family glycosyltransferase [Hydrogenophilus thiooxidans]|uniref:ArnT family glycosyltransferase n=1 Tax=Hydrogenophilus thiooxidans TaxID=2820326 RepID=UPI001C230790|nr:glycosyltransferase family 39 protein [Hydrogenophilus thiooxidans]